MVPQKKNSRINGRNALSLFGMVMVIVVPALIGLTCYEGSEAGDDGRRISDNLNEEPGTSDPGECLDGQRIFNGECRVECTHLEDCPLGTQCMNLDDGSALCLPYRYCAYLGSDTQCVGTGTYMAETRGGMSSLQPYASTPPNADPNDVTDNKDGFFVADEDSLNYNLRIYSDYELSEDGCQGNAEWVKVVAIGDPACGMLQAVKRCRRYDKRCVLVTGTTVDRVSP